MIRSLVPTLALSLLTLAQAQQQAIYVSDAGNFAQPPWQILKFDIDGDAPEVFISEELDWPQDIVFHPTENVVLISNLNSGRINRYDAQTGVYLSEFASGIGGPTRMKIGADGLLYVLQWSGNGKVLRYELDGDFVDEFTTVGVTQSIGIDWDDEGNLYVSSYSGSTIRKFSPGGEDLGSFISSGLSGPTNIWFDANNDLLVINYNGNSVKRFNSLGVFQGEFIVGLQAAEGQAFLPDGRILIGNGGSSSVKMFTSTGEYIEDVISSGAGGLIRPNAVVIHGTGMNGLKETQLTQSELVKPSIGRIFHVAPEWDGDLAELQLIGPKGDLVMNIPITPEMIWTAQDVPAGVYHLTALLKNGSRAVQRIVVK